MDNKNFYFDTDSADHVADRLSNGQQDDEAQRLTDNDISKTELLPKDFDIVYQIKKRATANLQNRGNSQKLVKALLPHQNES